MIGHTIAEVSTLSLSAPGLKLNQLLKVLYIHVFNMNIGLVLASHITISATWLVSSIVIPS